MAIKWSGMMSNRQYAAGPGKYFNICVGLDGTGQAQRHRQRPSGKEAGSGPYSCTWIQVKGKGYSGRDPGSNVGCTFLGAGDIIEGYSSNGTTYFFLEHHGLSYTRYTGTYNASKHGWDGTLTEYSIAPTVGSTSSYWWEKRRYASGEPFHFVFDGTVYETGSSTTKSGWRNVKNVDMIPNPSKDPGEISFVSLRDYITSGSYRGYLDRWLSKAYTDAVMSLPWTTMNNIANIIDTAGMIMNILGGNLDSVGSLADLWLGYRYVYSTTKMDVNEAVEIVDRLSVFDRSTEITSNSVVHADGKTIRCSVTLDSDAFLGARSFSKKWGVQLDAYRAWDMVPYSFIVDWFLDVGGKLEYFEGWGNAVKLRPSSRVWFSISDEQETDEARVSRYYRWTDQPPVVTPVYVNHAAGGRTLIQRGIDVLALFG